MRCVCVCNAGSTAARGLTTSGPGGDGLKWSGRITRKLIHALTGAPARILGTLLVLVALMAPWCGGAHAQIFVQPYSAPSGLGGFMQGLFGSSHQAEPPQQPANPQLYALPVPQSPRLRAAAPNRSLAPRSSANGDAPKSRNASASLGGGLRTMCVRLCDGYYWPMTFDARRSRLEHDARVCSASCATEARLFVMPNSGEAHDMVDQQGHPYAKLPNAFKYRKIPANSCSCRPDPWDEQARARHQAYAAQEPKRDTPVEVSSIDPADADANSAPAGTAAAAIATPDGASEKIVDPRLSADTRPAGSRPANEALKPTHRAGSGSAGARAAKPPKGDLARTPRLAIGPVASPAGYMRQPYVILPPQGPPYRIY